MDLGCSDDGSDVDGEVEIIGVEPPRLSNQERLRLAKRRRAEQLKRWGQREREWKKVADPAKSNGHSGAGSGFLRNGKGVCFEPSIVLLEAAARNDLEEVRALLKMGANPDSTNEDGLTALHQCCIDDSEEMMKILIHYGGDPNATDTEKWTPLHAAATCGHLHLVKFLIDSGAELLSVNADGNMPYDLCEDETTLSYIENQMAQRGVTQELIDGTRSETERRMLRDLQALQLSGGDLEFRDPQSNAMPLHVASANGYLSVVEFLLEHHASTEVEDEDLWQPIHAAACWGHLEVVELLAQNGANVSAKTRNGETPLDICEDPDIKERLIQLKEQRLLSEQPRVRRSRSASTRTQSIRRTSLREKMNTTKRDVRDEKLYFMQSFDDKRLKPPPPPHGCQEPVNQTEEVIDLHDVELTMMPNQDSLEHGGGGAPSGGNPNFMQPSPPRRPPRSGDHSSSDDKSGQFVNRVILSSSASSSSPPGVSVRVNSSPPIVVPSKHGANGSGNSQIVGGGSPATSSPQNSSSGLPSQTLSDLKKKRSMSRVNSLPSCQQPQQTMHAHRDANFHHVDRTRSSPPSATSFPPPPPSGGRNDDIGRQSKPKARRSKNAPHDDDRVHVDNSSTARKFASTNSEVVGPSGKKNNCCKVM